MSKHNKDPDAAGPSKPRNYDRESGQKRTDADGKKILLPHPLAESDNESSTSEPEAKLKAINEKRPKSRPLKKVPLRAKTPPDVPDDERSAHPAKIESAPGIDFLHAMAHSQGCSPISYPELSTYVPDCTSLFSVAVKICEMIQDNEKLYKLYPQFHSLSFFLYVGHLYYYHILRIRLSACVLTPPERRCLRRYETAGYPELWSVPSPLIGILQSYGIVDPPNKFYGKIIPSLPDFTQLPERQGLTGYHTVPSIARSPCIPHLQKFLYNFMNQPTIVENNDIVPLRLPLTPLIPYIGLIDSAPANEDFQSLIFSGSFVKSPEIQEGQSRLPLASVKHALQKYNVPNIANDSSLNDLTLYLGLTEGTAPEHLSKLLQVAASVCTFFPDSQNLSSISTVTHEELITPITWTCPSQQGTSLQVWYPPKLPMTYSFTGCVNTVDSSFLYKVAAAVSPNSIYSNLSFPTAMPPDTYDPFHNGPYFVSSNLRNSLPITLVESLSQQDPRRTMLARATEALYIRNPSRP
jgi:hypothetical protein